MMHLTTKEIDALIGIVDSEFHDGSHPVGNPVWTWSANPFSNARTFSGVVASLNKKGFTTSTDLGKDSTIVLTQAGFDALKEAAPEFVKGRGLV